MPKMLAIVVAVICALPATADEKLPKVVLIGDSIRIGYAPLVAKKLQGQAEVVSSAQNGFDSANVLVKLDEWVIREKPALIHFNCGLHDLKFDKKRMAHQVPITVYEQNLRKLVGRIRQETSAILIFANTTPIHDQRHAQRKANFERFEADVQKYNAAAAKIMKELAVPLHDLHEVVIRGDMRKMLAQDGTHYTPAANEILATAVAQTISRQLPKPKGK